MPPLRERAEDIPWLIDYFVSRYNHKFNRRTRPISDKLVTQMKHYHWPSNIRQLESLIKRYVVLGSEQEIASEVRSKEQLFTLAHVELEEGDSVPLKKITKRLVRDVERQVIANVLQRHRWNRRRAARTLQISYRALLYKVKEARIVPAVGLEPSSDSVEALPDLTEG